jgi:hypothetical protein
MRKIVVIEQWLRNRWEARFHCRRERFSYPRGKQKARSMCCGCLNPRDLRSHRRGRSAESGLRLLHRFRIRRKGQPGKGFVWDEVKPLNAPFPGCEYLPITDERRKIVDPINNRSAIAGYGLCTSDLSSAAKGLAP